ncbi:MAG: hypothetical protein C5B53_00740 [Candidatus Melainabacteria bacterium]|nr:MAG: hypothetical protein C5B53_00740 [Candidatus Melainabacteria bacterium]
MMLLLLGLILMLLVLRDVIHSVVPRGMSTQFCLAPFLVRRVLWPPFSSLASRITSPHWKAEVLSLFAPTVLLLLLITWILLFTLSVGLIAWALASHFSPAINSPLNAFYVSAASVLTLGTSDFIARSADVKVLMLGDALMGIILTASLISLMFALIGAIQPREALVSMIANLGGSPPSGLAILETFSSMKGHAYMPAFFDECHHWCAEVLETHKSFPILPYFRSNDSLTSWITALGAVLDSISLMLGADPAGDHFSARMTYLIGCKLLNEFTAIFKLTLPEPDDISDDEFHQLYLGLQSAGYSANSEEAAKANFRLLRLRYIAAHRALCDYLVVPIPPYMNKNLVLLPPLSTG